MYDWSTRYSVGHSWVLRFSCCWKDVRLKLDKRARPASRQRVSVVVERMYDWSYIPRYCNERINECFSCCWKDVRLKLSSLAVARTLSLLVSVVVERMYDWSRLILTRNTQQGLSFSCCWKDVRLKLRNQLIENKWFLTVGFWSVFRKWSICTKSAIIFENLGWFGWLLDCFW